MYAVHPEVNRGAVTAVARKRQIGAPYTDLCNNASQIAGTANSAIQQT